MPKGIGECAYDAVLFDVDGTLTNSLVTVILGLADTHEKFDGFRPSDDEITATIGMALRDQLIMYRTEPVGSDEMVEMVNYALDRFEFHSHHTTEFTLAVEGLKHFKRVGLKIGLVTSKERADVTAFLSRFTARDHIDTVVCASDVTNPKPHPESAFKACHELGVSVERTLLIGDSVYDLRCARSAGVASAAVCYGAGRRQDLLAENPDFVFETPDDVQAWAISATSTLTCLERK